MPDLVIFTAMIALICAFLFVVSYLKYRWTLITQLLVPNIIIVFAVAVISYVRGKYGNAGNIDLLLAPIGFGSFALSAVLLYRIVVRPLQELRTKARMILDTNDLTVELAPSARNDEIGMLFMAFRAFLENMRELAGHMQQGVSNLSSHAFQIAEAANAMASTSQEQSAVVNQVSSTVEELAESSKNTVQNATAVLNESAKALQAGSKSEDIGNSANQSMQAITQQVLHMAQGMQLLHEKTQQIGDIIASVNKIADQSTLLAVNAGIEAASAGEHGRGFAVVAGEVKALATQSQNATSTIHSILHDIQQSSEKVLESAAASQEQVELSIEAVQRLQSLTNELSAAIKISYEKSEWTAKAYQEQSSGIQQIRDAIQQVAQGSIDTADQAQELEMASDALSDMGTLLGKALANYKVQ